MENETTPTVKRRCQLCDTEINLGDRLCERHLKKLVAK